MRLELTIPHRCRLSFSPALITKFDDIVSRYPEGKQKSALLPILHLVQAEFGWVSAPAMDKVAEYLHLQDIEVYEVASFYSMYFLRPQGKYVLEVCRTGSLLYCMDCRKK